MNDLNRISKKKFTYQEVMTAFHLESYEELKNIIDEWSQSGLIRPVLASGLTSFRPHVYNRYQKNVMQVDYDEARERIHRLDPRMIAYYHAHPEEYVRDEKNIVLLSSYLKEHGEELKDPAMTMSIKERSYDIYGREKALENGCRKILSACHITLQDLNCYQTFKPFFFTLIQNEGYAVVLENKDPWDSVSRVMKGHTMFLGKKISCLIYGEGRKAASADPSGRLYAFLDSLHLNLTGVLYCGDLDKAGVRIFSDCCRYNPELSVQPFTELYLEMIQKAPDETVLLENTEDRHTKSYDLSFLDQFSKKDRNYIQGVLDENKRIPQEILNRTDYRRMCR